MPFRVNDTLLSKSLLNDEPDPAVPQQAAVATGEKRDAPTMEVTCIRAGWKFYGEKGGLGYLENLYKASALGKFFSVGKLGKKCGYKWK